MRGSDTAASLLVLARRDPRGLAGLNVEIWLREHAPPPEWAVWLASVQKVTRGEPQLGFWVDVKAAAGAYIVDFDARDDPPGYRGIWRVLADGPVVVSSHGSILLARRVLRIEGRRLGSNQAWRRALAAARGANDGPGRWDLQTLAQTFLGRQSRSPEPPLSAACPVRRRCP